MNLQFYNTSQPESFNALILPRERPGFLDYEPAMAEMEKQVKQYEHITDVVIIAHGGSITGIYGLYESLKEQATKRVHFVQTTDPDYISALKKQLPKETTLVIAISKSGENTTQIEALLQFQGFQMLFITSFGSPLYLIHNDLGAHIWEHPSIGGRYTGFTEVLLLPAMICGLSVKEFFNGGREFHKKVGEENDAWKLASVMWQLEQKGYVDVFMPFYSHYVYPWNLVIVQLCHESFGKAGKGGTYVAFEAPESQHHTNQRFFGGIENMLGLFIGLENFSTKLITQIPEGAKIVPFKNHTFGVLGDIPLSESMKFEMDGTLEDAAAQRIPAIKMLIRQRDAKSLGEFLAFWQLYAVYSSLLRNVDPFDQPQVEASKKLSFEK